MSTDQRTKAERIALWLLYGAAAIMLAPRTLGEWAYLIVGVLLGARLAGEK